MTTERKTAKDEYEIQQRMARLAPTDVTSSERWAFYMLERMARSGLVVRVDEGQ